LRVGRYEDDGYFCTIEVTGTAGHHPGPSGS
jgi:uncharacterized protein YqfB (UPF0267 family)